LRATVHYREAVRLRPGDGEALYNLANALMASGAPDEAMTLYGRAIAARPDAAEPHAELALLLLIHPDPARRDAARAVRLAERAAELTGRVQPGVLDVLAGAYAAAGALDRAVAAAEAALEHVPRGRDDVAAAIRARLEGYRRERAAARPR